MFGKHSKGQMEENTGRCGDHLTFQMLCLEGKRQKEKLVSSPIKEELNKLGAPRGSEVGAALQSV